MNTDERFNYYGEKMQTVGGPLAAQRLERAMSQMLEAGCTQSLIWQYAEREINAIRSTLL